MSADNGADARDKRGYFSKWNAMRAAKKTFPQLPLVEVD